MGIFGNKKEVKKPSIRNRRFTAASEDLRDFKLSFQKINGDLKSDLIGLTLRARELAKNSEVVNSWLNLMIRSTLGNTGFILHSTAYNDNGLPDTIANNQLETLWNQYQTSYKKYVSACQTMNGIDFDRHVLFNLLVDGEIFIRKIKDNKSKFGIRFQLIDSLNVDILYNGTFSNGDKICMGVKVNEYNKPLSYFIRKNKNLDYYTTGERIEVPASEIIHVYRRNFAGQIRGYTPLAPVLLSLNSLDKYTNSQIKAALLNANFMGIYEKVGTSDYNYDDADSNGDFATELESNVFRFAPEGYSLKTIQNNHPNSNVGGFLKAILKNISGCLGMSYNKISSDYESTSYSSLRQSNIEDAVTIKELQQFLIDNWKSVQYSEFLKYLLLSDLTNLPYSKIEKFQSFNFQGRNFEYLDPAKEMQAIQLRLNLGLSSPIEEIQLAGKDPEDVLDQWQRWEKMKSDRNIKFNESQILIDNTLNENQEIQNNEQN